MATKSLVSPFIAVPMDEAATLSTNAGARITRRTFGGFGAALALLGSQSVHALCAGVKEEGQWRNLNNQAQPALIYVRMNCGDQVLNGQQTSTTYKVRAWTRQSSGQYYGRPWVDATYHSWNKRQWLVGKVSTGGYLDHMWMDAVERNGVPHLHVIIKHESLDSKPSAQSEHWFVRAGNS